MLCVNVIEIKYLKVLLTVNYIYKLMLIFFYCLLLLDTCTISEVKFKKKKLIDLLTFDKIHVFLFKCWCILKNYLTMIKNKYRFIF